MTYIRLTENELNKHSSNLSQQLMKKGHQHAVIKEQIDKAKLKNRMRLLNKNAREAKRNISISVTFN